MVELVGNKIDLVIFILNSFWRYVDVIRKIIELDGDFYRFDEG